MTTSNFQVQSFFDPATWTISHVVHAGVGSQCAIIDSVLDYDSKSGRTSTRHAQEIIAFVKTQQLSVQWHIETHAHADHLSAAPYLKAQLGGQIAIGARITHVQAVFKPIFNLEPEFALDGSQFDHLFHDGDCFKIGDIPVLVMGVPGHTPACAAYVVGDAAGEQAVFAGDTIFAPDVGTARCDFPGGDAKTLYQSVKKLLSLPNATKIYLCHDYPPVVDGQEVRAPITWTTVQEERAHNIHVRDGVSEGEFVTMRTTRDQTLAMPNLILPSVQVNIRAGHLPPQESNGVSYLKIPVNAL